MWMLAPMGTSSNAQFSHSILNFAYYDAYQTLTRVQMSHVLGGTQEKLAYGIVSVVISKEMLIASSSMTCEKVKIEKSSIGFDTPTM